jgi:hypothetical protein
MASMWAAFSGFANTKSAAPGQINNLRERWREYMCVCERERERERSQINK